MENTSANSTEGVKWVRLDGSEVKGITFISPTKLAKEGTTGIILEGTYLGAVMGRYGKNDFRFQNLEGDTVIINGGGNLEYNMKSVDVGTLVQVTYKGLRPMKSQPGKTAHNFSILKAEDAD